MHMKILFLQLSVVKRHLVLIILFVLGVIFILNAYIGPKNVNIYILEKSCSDKCTKEGKFDRLVHTNQSLPANAGAYVIPPRCECY